ncbi:hypothetical protein TUMSATVNIG1_60410 (plasmid) [Vibrio nigripulchritudo]|uniref:hypothetical protein n=1 Tax=Vibrio nigripulchritudo TaxID=28173 RepID=UPI00190DCB1F|nr:hypothetical protein [Vibrio nigripulchritudo]BCL74055.1 hypothetical protein VNTUMSATTG_59920 [Vibrio nigripulchritudo]BDU35432.1 hypothetical protein TUMSATVNIG1_60410 [Vibrio nigripulchritudo]
MIESNPNTARPMIMKAAIDEIGSGSKRFSECMQLANMQFHSHDKHFNVKLVSQACEEKIVRGCLIGVYSQEGEFFRYAHQLPHIELADEQKAFFEELAKFGQKLVIPELTEGTISLTPQERDKAISLRLKAPMQLHRNDCGEIESIYSIKAIVSLVASVMNAKSYFVNDDGKFHFYIALMEEFNSNNN